MTLLQRWARVMAEYRQIKTPAEDVCDVLSAILFTIAAVLYGMGIGAMIEGCSHG